MVHFVVFWLLAPIAWLMNVSAHGVCKHLPACLGMPPTGIFCRWSLAGRSHFCQQPPGICMFKGRIWSPVAFNLPWYRGCSYGGVVPPPQNTCEHTGTRDTASHLSDL